MSSNLASAHAADTTIERVTIFGAGSIGTAWAIVFATAGLQVKLYDPDKERLRKSKTEIGERLSYLESFSLVSNVARATDRIEFEVDPVLALQSADYVQECGPEDLALKKKMFDSFAANCPPNTILASSSSAITISTIAAENSARGRCLIVHPGNPPYMLRVAEIVPAPFTDDSVIDRVEQFLLSADMIPVRLSREIEGFVFNRLQGALLREAYFLVRDQVVSATELDKLVRHGLGLRWSVIGPFETAELNTRGGLQGHAARMGAAYARMGNERGQNDPWPAELVQSVADALAANSDGVTWEDRVLIRDQRLMAMYRTQREIGVGRPSTALKPSGAI